MEIKGMPTSEHPQYKIRKKGVSSLSNAELIAVLCGMDSLEPANELLGNIIGGIRSLSYYGTLGFEALGLTKRQSEKLDAALELYMRVHSECPVRKPLTSPDEIYDMFAPRLSYAREEHLMCLLLDIKGRIISETTIAVGGLKSAIVEIPAVLRPAIIQGAERIVLVHNHPSGNSFPSPDDIELTKNISVAAEFMGIKLTDHLIIGDNTYYSFREQNPEVFRLNADPSYIDKCGESVSDRYHPATYTPASFSASHDEDNWDDITDENEGNAIER
jgi:DNA repair protein RadC